MRIELKTVNIELQYEAPQFGFIFIHVSSTSVHHHNMDDILQYYSTKPSNTSMRNNAR